MPVVTLGISVLALNTVTMNMAMNNDSESIAICYIKSFKENLLKGCQLSLVLVLCCGSLILSTYCLFFLKDISILIGKMGVIVLFITNSILMLFLFPYNARYEDGILHSIKTSIQIAALHWKTTLYLLVCGIAYVLIMTWNNFFFTGGMIFFLFMGFSSTSFLICSVLWPIFQQYE